MNISYAAELQEMLFRIIYSLSGKKSCFVVDGRVELSLFDISVTIEVNPDFENYWLMGDSYL